MKIRNIFLLASLVFCFACAKESNDPQAVLSPLEEAADANNSDNDEQMASPGASESPITITVSLPEDLTRISLTQDEESADGVVKVAWEATDKLYINGEEFSIVTPLNENRRIATFTGPSVEAPYTILYGAATEEAANALILSEQTQNGNSSTAHLPYVAMLSGVNTLEDVCFNQSWATTNGGTLKQTGILRLRIKLPAAVTSVESLTVTAPSAIFYTNNACSATTRTLKLNFDSAASPTSNVINAYLMLPWSDVAIAASTDLEVTVYTTDHDVYHRVEDAGGKTLSMGKVNAIKLTCDTPGTNVTLDDFAGGTGVSGDPWLIGNKRQLLAVNGAMADGATKYFKMIDDVNMSGETWTPLNTDGTNNYIKFVNFDGNGKTISYLDKHMFYVFKGSIYNLTLDHSNITNRGILAEFIQGTGHTVTDVNVTNGTITSTSSKTGGLIGQINSGSSGLTTATISGCQVSGTNVMGNGYVGGLIGEVNELVSISNCTYTGGTVTSSDQYTGGLIGNIQDFASTITDCHVENAIIDVSGITGTNPRAGGFVGILNNAATISGCSVGTSSKKVTIKLGTPSASGTKHNCGGFVGVHYGTITKNGDTRTTAYVTITCTNTNTGYQLNVGGFGGFVRGTIEYADANVTMTGLKGTYIGGFVGYATKQANAIPCLIDHCSVTGTVSGNNYTGGFVGYVEDNTPVFSNNTASGSVSGSDYTGGFAGCCVTGSFSRNNSSMSVSGTSYAGGFAGQINPGSGETTTITECFYYTGDSQKVSASYRYAGGLIGTKDGAGTLSLNNCYVASNVFASSGWAGGLLARHSAGTSNLTNCYVSGGVSTIWGVGGIVGQVSAAGLSVVRCMPFNESIKATMSDSGQHYSSGAVIAYGKDVNVVVSWCYRISDMASRFKDCTGNAANVIEQHAFIDTAAPIPQRKSLTYGYCHHGRNTNHSLCDLVHCDAIGENWSSSIWDWSSPKTRPTLINNPE